MHVETDCTITHEGKIFEAGGAVVDPVSGFAIGYTKFRNTDPKYVKWLDKGYPVELTNWRGEEIGHGLISAKWKVNSFIGTYMYQIWYWIDNVQYTGRTMGNGMIWKGKRVAGQ